MKISINVLPDEQKEKIQEEKKIGFVLKLAFSFVAVLLFVNAVLYSMQVVLGIEHAAAKKSSETTTAGSRNKEGDLEKMFQEANTQVANFSKTNLNIPNWSRVLARISELAPGGVRVNKLSSEGSDLKISGFSKTREAFLNFQDELKKEGFQFSVDISNLVASNDFNFDLDIVVPQEYLTRE